MFFICIFKFFQLEAQHLSKLGREWKDREREREESYQLRCQEVLRLQEEWQTRSLQLDKDKQALNQERERLAGDRKALEAEQRQLRDQRGAAMEKLRARVKELENDMTDKVAEFARLKQRLVAVEQENRKLKAEKNKRKDEQQQQQEQLVAPNEDELRRLRSDLFLVETERDQLRRRLKEDTQAVPWIRNYCFRIWIRIRSHLFWLKPFKNGTIGNKIFFRFLEPACEFSCPGLVPKSRYRF